MNMRSQQGSITVETAVIAPALLLLMLLVVYAGRAAQADLDITAAAAQAARAASITATPAAAQAAAQQAAAGNLATAGVDCAGLHVTVDTTNFVAGGTVTVTATCTLDNRDLALLAVPGRRTSTATSTHPVDTFRGAP